MWPELPYTEWKETLETIHLWTEIVGKVKLELSPFLNQWWEVTFFVTANGLTSGAIPFNDEIFQMDFDFIHHELIVQSSWSKSNTFTLKPMSVAEFYDRVLRSLRAIGVEVKIWPVPVEMSILTPFQKDTEHAAYDERFVEDWWRILVRSSVVFDHFRSSFRGKSSPIQFFWGSFDLSGTRYSGKLATPPKLKGVMGKIMRYAENEENFAFGFWPGDERYPEPAYYSYIYPSPSGFRNIKLSGGGFFHEQLGECILPYQDVRQAKKPAAKLLHFLESSYLNSAKLANWNTSSLRTKEPRRRVKNKH